MTSTNVAVCKDCGKLFNYVSGERICYNCRDEDEKKLIIVKTYLHENPGAQLHTVCNETGATMRQINTYLREERLQAINKSGLPVIHCKKCGVGIDSGYYCKKCSQKHTNIVSGLKQTNIMRSKTVSNYTPVKAKPIWCAC